MRRVLSWRRGLTWPLAMSMAFAMMHGCECASHDDPGGATTEPDEAMLLEGEPIEPPFAVRENLDDLYLVWFDEEGVHVAEDRESIPVDRRQYVRVAQLSAPSDDPEHVYLADARRPREDGSYEVRRFHRDSFEALIDQAMGRGQGEVHAAGSADVVIYGASWCGACRAAARFFHAENIPFVERDVEREAGAREEMTEKARAAGVPTGSIPIIDFRGTILRGFDERRIRSLM